MTNASSVIDLSLATAASDAEALSLRRLIAARFSAEALQK